MTHRTRRQLFRTGLAVAGGIAAVIARAQEKIAQNQVQYQTTPKDGNKCSACMQFEAPHGCKIVAGNIDPNGWCIAFSPKDSSKG